MKSLKTLPGCPTCHLPVCLCDRLRPWPLRHRFVVLQHPREQHHPLGTVQLLQKILPQLEIHVGLSWPGLPQRGNSSLANWLVLYPFSLPQPPKPILPPLLKHVVLSARGQLEPNPQAATGVIVLDGSWSQVKSLWWRNLWLRRCARLLLCNAEQTSIYGKWRREPQKHHLSSLEALGAAASLMGEEMGLEAYLQRLLRTFMQRYRDAQISYTP